MSRPDPKRSIESYRGLAADYDESCRRIMSIRESAVDLLQLRAGDVVVDVASGTGLSFELLIGRIGSTGHLIAIEHSPEMMAKARERVAAAGWRNVTLIEAAVEDARIEATIDAFRFHYTHDVLQSPAALERLFDRAKPLARVAVAGTKLTSWWLAPINLWALFRARRYLTTYAGLRRPWSHLIRLVPDLSIQPRHLGIGYLAAGRYDRAG